MRTQITESQAMEFIADLRRQRKIAADHLRSILKLRREIQQYHKMSKLDIKSMANHTIYHPRLRISVSSLIREARAAYNFSRTPLPGAPGCGGTYIMNDGYSLCGLADAHAAERDSAYEEARILIRAAKIVKRQRKAS